MDKVTKQAELFLGEVERKEQRVLEDDLNARYPHEFEDWKGIYRWIVPQDLGGDLGSIEQLFLRGRCLSRRNLTCAIAFGQSFLGSLPIWIAGNQEQKELIAHKLLNEKATCVALTELDNGSDLMASKVTYVNELLSGEKWCINNATIAGSLSLLCQTQKGLTLLFIDKDQLRKESFKYLPPLKTHGIKGADISGIQFINAKIPASMAISRMGKGLEVIAKTLQVSRTLCSAFSLGALDSCLRMAIDFSYKRELYGKKLFLLDSVNTLIKKAYLKLLLIEGVSLVMNRAITIYPQSMSLYSAVIKYQIPKVTDEAILLIGEVLGARSYLNEQDYPLFEKFKRDHAVVSLFDGSSGVNLFLIATQTSNILKHLEANDSYSDVFNLEHQAPLFVGQGLRLSNRNFDFAISHYNSLKNKIHKDLFEIVESKISRLKKESQIDYDPKSYAARLRAQLYSQIICACTYISFFYENKTLFAFNLDSEQTVIDVIFELFGKEQKKYHDYQLEQYLSPQIISHFQLDCES